MNILLFLEFKIVNNNILKNIIYIYDNKITGKFKKKKNCRLILVENYTNIDKIT